MYDSAPPPHPFCSRRFATPQHGLWGASVTSTLCTSTWTSTLCSSSRWPKRRSRMKLALRPTPALYVLVLAALRTRSAPPLTHARVCVCVQRFQIIHNIAQAMSRWQDSKTNPLSAHFRALAEGLVLTAGRYAGSISLLCLSLVCGSSYLSHLRVCYCTARTGTRTTCARLHTMH